MKLRGLTVGVLLVVAACGDDSLPPADTFEAGVDRGLADRGRDGRVDATLVDSLTQDGLQLDGAKTDGSKTDGPRPDAPKPDGPKPDAPKPDAPKPDAPKPDAPKPDAPRPDGPRLDGPRPDSPKPDAPRPDAPRPDTLKADSPRPDTLRADAPGPDASAATCGNAVREGTEQCDDGNKIHLDGCDGLCKFEQSQRATYLKVQWTTDTFCTKNAFGGAFVNALGRNMMQQSVDASIADGSVTVLFRMLNLDDLSGTNDSSVSVGVLEGTPVSGTGYDGTNDLDWWYTAAPSTINAQRNPVNQLSGSIAAKVLTAGPGKMTMTFDIVGTPATFTLSSAKITITNGATSTPLSSSGSPPGHLASEHLDPLLVSYASAGTKTTTGSGQLCGNAAAQGFKGTPIPQALVGLFGCSGYTTANTVLDLLVGGCTVPIVGQVMAATQPDSDDPAVAPVGAGPPYTLTANSSKVVTTCRDKNNQVVTLSACLADAAYSVSMRFATGRVIIK